MTLPDTTWCLQLRFALGLEQSVERTRRKLGKRFIGGAKTVNRPVPFSVSTSPAAFTAATRSRFLFLRGRPLRTGESGSLPAPLNGFPRQGLIESSNADQAVDERAHRRNVAEFHAEECRYEIEMEHSGEPPVQGSNDDERRRGYVEVFHFFKVSLLADFAVGRQPSCTHGVPIRGGLSADTVCFGRTVERAGGEPTRKCLVFVDGRIER
jgi:hypothetical protein